MKFVVDELPYYGEFWKNVPDWRFGQLISNLGRQFEWTPGGFFYMEDEEFMNELEEILAKLNRYE